MVSEPLPDFPLDVAVPNTFGEALAGLSNRGFLGSRKWQEQQWRANRDGAHPDILEFEKVFIRRMSKLGVPMFASEVYRTPERQADLYALGNSKARPGQSPHQYGLAIDLVHSVRGWSLSQREWALIGHVGKEVIQQKGLALKRADAWGGDWKFYDPAHWQVDGWKAIKEDFPWPK